MITRKTIQFVSLLLIDLFVITSCSKSNTNKGADPNVKPPVVPSTPIAIALAGNAFVTQTSGNSSEAITDAGLTNWANANTVTTTYFRLGQTGELSVAVKAKVPAGNSSIKVSVNGTPFTITAMGNNYKTYFAGTINVNAIGYVKVDMQGVSKTGDYFADVSDIMIGGAATSANVLYANDPANYYWSRRGPSCHLNYTIPTTDKEYFYSELTVPEGEDKIGSYFMANGFGEGYFGIQVNSPTERRILFSVWDPPSGQGSTTLVRKGEGVTAGRFGGEGTGGQSYMIFNWKAGTTYKFLTQGKPDGNGSTIYTSWFYAPENAAWKLMATWSRPNLSKYLSNFHGFLENFLPNNGYLGRKAFWSNQWVRLASGTWSEVTEFKFTADATAANNQRMDYAGGVENGKFFLTNGGFFASNTNRNTLFNKAATGNAPVIDFNVLP